MSAKCWPWSHHWLKWATVEQGKIHHAASIASESKVWIGEWKRQERTCDNCGKLQMRTVRTGVR